MYLDDIKPENIYKLTTPELNRRMKRFIAQNEPELKRAIFKSFDNIRQAIKPFESIFLNQLQANEIPLSMLIEIDKSIESLVLDDLSDYWTESQGQALNEVVNAIEETYKVGFTPTAFDRNFENWTRERAGMLITNFTQEQLNSFRDTLLYFNRSIELAPNPREIAVYLQRFTGLTQRQSNSLLKARTELLKQGINLKTVNNTLFRRARDMINYRAERIARTELTTAYNQSMIMNFNEANAQGIIRDGTPIKVWYAAEDERTCDICGVLHEQVADINGAFQGGYYSPSAHPNCRCSILIYLQTGI